MIEHLLLKQIDGKHFMLKSSVALFLVGILFAGCVTIRDFKRLDRFNEIATDYKIAMRWSDFETVNSYRKEGRTEAAFEKVQQLEDDIQIISYDVLDISVSADHKEVRQVVEIHYYRRDRMIEKTLKTVEVWTYDEEQNRWLLTGGFPDFD
jgi:hypothetical protein